MTDIFISNAFFASALELLSVVPTTVWVLAGIILLLLVWAGVNSARNKREKNVEALPEKENAPEPVAEYAVEEGIPEEIIAAICAAVAVAMGGSEYRIRSMRRIGSRERSNWAAAGLSENVAPFVADRK